MKFKVGETVVIVKGYRGSGDAYHNFPNGAKVVIKEICRNHLEYIAEGRDMRNVPLKQYVLPHHIKRLNVGSHLPDFL